MGSLIALAFYASSQPHAAAVSCLRKARTKAEILAAGGATPRMTGTLPGITSVLAYRSAAGVWDIQREHDLLSTAPLTCRRQRKANAERRELTRKPGQQLLRRASAEAALKPSVHAASAACSRLPPRIQPQWGEHALVASKQQQVPNLSTRNSQPPYSAPGRRPMSCQADLLAAS